MRNASNFARVSRLGCRVIIGDRKNSRVISGFAVSRVAAIWRLCVDACVIGAPFRVDVLITDATGDLHPGSADNTGSVVGCL